ncbi:hypothetical protein [Noviherbaspirillum malthae]|uniref:hypothetical protein n=1 Tax=Noviherbaspirillum malthae TaxID=1260987 RepID=UPI001890B0F6|nr:hypothetical protein [Noviherbaspirillum malthae]
MSRIRTIKPEFWTSEQVVECSPLARLMFVGMWNFCDDNGIHPDSVKRLKMEIFPSDTITDREIQTMVDELLKVKLLERYSVENQAFLRVTGWKKHQRIEKPTYRHPLPNSEKIDEQSPPAPVYIAEDSPTNPQTVGDDSSSARVRNGMESNGKEWKGMEVITNPDGLVVTSDAGDQGSSQGKTAKPNCPHQQIIDLYHEALPMCPQVKTWTPKRSSQLRARWNEDKSRQNLDYWRKLFEYIAAECPFLVGQTKEQFLVSLEWITRPENFAKIREGMYETRRRA